MIQFFIVWGILFVMIFPGVFACTVLLCRAPPPTGSETERE